jgi:hypothetical protein
MGRPEKPVDVSGGAVAAFARDLRQLRALAGNPTYRDMAGRALFAPSVLSSAASGRRLPTLQVTLAFVAACGGDTAAWRRRWLELTGDLTAGRRPAGQSNARRPGLPRPAQLPLRPRGFVGRTGELRRLRGPATAPVVISGPVGVGKSALALQYAHDIAADMHDGQLYADLGLLPRGEAGAQAVLSGFLQALGVPAERVPDAADQRAGLYRSLLAGRRLVVLLDNVCNERQVRPLLAETPHSVTIMVSRNPLLGLRDVRRIRLDVLPRTDSIAMIAAAVPAAAAAEPDECDWLAELCSDLPLALDIAARKLVVRAHLPLRRVTRRLSRPGDVLDWLCIGDLSVRESLSMAYLQLSIQARALVQRLAWLPTERPMVWVAGRGPDSPEPASIDLVEDGLATDELIDELAEAGMLRHTGHPGAYRLDPLVRAVVTQQASGRAQRLVTGPAARRHRTGHDCGAHRMLISDAVFTS